MNKGVLIPVLASILVLGVFGIQNVFAVPIPVTNHSFEDPPLAPGTSSNIAPGWTLSNSIVRNGFPGATDGSNVLVIEQITSSPPDGGTATQVVTTVAPDTRYILTFDIFANPFGNGVGLVFIKVNGIDGAGGQFNSGPFNFVTLSLTWDSPSTGPLIGQPLEISFGGFVITTGPNGGVAYDNIRLEAIDLFTVDDDGDTVPNPLDVCPGQDDLLDTDGDGIPDCLDPEPNLGCGPGTIQVGTLCLPDNTALNACIADLGDAQDELITTQTNLAACTDDLFTLNNELTTCTAGLGICSSNLSTCVASLNVCEPSLATCQTDLTAAQTRVAELEALIANDNEEDNDEDDEEDEDD